jgi:hypothetical protein
LYSKVVIKHLEEEAALVDARARKLVDREANELVGIEAAG